MNPSISGPNTLQERINTDLYPLSNLDDPRIGEWRKSLSRDGLLVLPDFLQQQALEQMIAEAESLAGEAYYRPVEGNIYLSPIDENWPADHPGRRTEPTEVGVVAADQFGPDSLFRALFDADEVLQFVAAIVGKGPLYRYQCPLGGINLAVMRKGNYLRWHFDLSDFVVSIPLQAPEGGGVYEYVRNLRTDAEPNHNEVHKVLDGDRSRVQILTATPGSLVLFEGRHTAHRVTPVEGERLRLGALFGFVDSPEATSTPYLRKIRYGRDS